MVQKIGHVTPRYLLDKVTVQADEIASKTGEASPFAKPVAKFPEDIPASEQECLRKAVLTAINSEIVPTYQKFATFLRVEYVPHGLSLECGPSRW